jgi:DNA-binding beta-propeller fold protein YncE
LAIAILGVGGLLAARCASSASSAAPGGPSRVIAIPGGARGIGFDDMGYVPELHRIVVPAAQTGALALIDPQSFALTLIPGITTPRRTVHGHGEGTTSATYAHGFLFASDRDTHQVVIVDPHRQAVLGRVPLSGGPDYLRYDPIARELWVTEPGAQQIEIFGVDFAPAPTLRRIATIRIPGGPESLIIDARRGLAYTNLWKRETLVIGVANRRIEARWPNGCDGSRGLAWDPRSRHLFVGCAEGKVSVLDAGHGGRVLGTAATGRGVDIIAYDASRHRVVAPGARSATMTILHVDPQGHLTLEAVYRTAHGAHCVAVAPTGRAFVCDPRHGRVLEFD